MKRSLLNLLFLSLVLALQAQELIIHVNQKGKVGFVDQSGQEVIKCKYESAFPFNDGLAIVMKSGKYGLVNSSGKEVLPLKYTSISSWNENLYIIKDGKKMGLADHSGIIVLKPQYSQISKANCYGKALIAVGGKTATDDNKNYLNGAKYGIIDVEGNVLVQAKYKGLYEFSFDAKEIYPFYEGMRLKYSYHYISDTLQTNCEYLGYSNNASNIYSAGLMDGKGKEIIKPGQYTYIMLPKSDMVRYYISKKKETICGYHNLITGKSFKATSFDDKLENLSYWTHGDFIGEIAPVNGSNWTFIDQTGSVLRSGYRKLIHSEAADIWAARNTSGEWDVFDDYNRNIENLSGYEEISFPANKTDKKLFSVKKDDLYGVITKKGEIVVPFEYEMIIGNTFDFIPVKRNGKWGILSSENASLIPCEYFNIVLPSEKDAKHFWVMKEDSLYYHYNLNTKQVSTSGYKSVRNFKDGIAFVTPDNFKVDDSNLNKAQLFKPNTALSNIANANLKKSSQEFGYLLSENNDLLCTLPVTYLYRENIIEAVKKNGYRPISESEAKNILLKATVENRGYDITSILSEDEWNY